MSKPDKDVLAKVRQWLEYADEDLRLARHGLTLSTGCPYRLIAYHAQQCAEKYIKAYLVYHGIENWLVCICVPWIICHWIFLMYIDDWTGYIIR